MKNSLTRPLSSLALGLLLFATSCKKNADPNPLGISVSGKTYRIASFTITPGVDLDGDGKPDTDLTILMDECKLDDTVTLQAGGKISVSFGATKCPDDNSTDGGTWTYDDTRKTLKTVDKDEPTSVTEFEVIESGNTLRAVEEFTQSGVTYRSTLLMKAI